MKKATLFFALSGVIVLLGAGASFLMLNGIAEKGAHLKSLKAEAKKPEELQAELATAQATADQGSIELAHLEKNIPELAYVPTMLKELEQFGTQCGVKVFGVKPYVAVSSAKKEKKKAEKPYTELSIEIKGKGRFRSVMKFVDAMKSFPKIVAVRTVALTPKFGTGNDVNYSNLDVTLELRAYLFKPAKGEDHGFPTVEIDPDAGKTPPSQGIPSNTPNPKSTDGKDAGKSVATLSTSGGATL